MATKLLKTISVPAEQTKKTTLASNLFYSKIEVFENKVVGTGNQTMTWFFKDYNGIDFVKANMNSQFAQVIFLTGINSKSRVVGLDFGSAQNLNAMNDTNRILFCSGMFSFGKTNTFAESVYTAIRDAFNNYQEHTEELEESKGQAAISPADELKKFKELLDMGVITQEEFDAKKKQLLNLPSLDNTASVTSNNTVVENDPKSKESDSITSKNMEKLEYFKKLLDEGKISEKEFVMMRKMIIGQ